MSKNAQVDAMKTQVEQLRIEASADRKKVSEAAQM